MNQMRAHGGKVRECYEYAEGHIGCLQLEPFQIDYGVYGFWSFGDYYVFLIFWVSKKIYAYGS